MTNRFCKPCGFERPAPLRENSPLAETGCHPLYCGLRFGSFPGGQFPIRERGPYAHSPSLILCVYQVCTCTNEDTVLPRILFVGRGVDVRPFIFYKIELASGKKELSKKGLGKIDFEKYSYLFVGFCASAGRKISMTVEQKGPGLFM